MSSATAFECWSAVESRACGNVRTGVGQLGIVESRVGVATELSYSVSTPSAIVALSRAGSVEQLVSGGNSRSFVQLWPCQELLQSRATPVESYSSRELLQARATPVESYSSRELLQSRATPVESYSSRELLQAIATPVDPAVSISMSTAALIDPQLLCVKGYSIRGSVLCWL